MDTLAVLQARSRASQPCNHFHICLAYCQQLAGFLLEQPPGPLSAPQDFCPLSLWQLLTSNHLSWTCCQLIFNSWIWRVKRNKTEWKAKQRNPQKTKDREDGRKCPINKQYEAGNKQDWALIQFRHLVTPVASIGLARMSKNRKLIAICFIVPLFNMYQEAFLVQPEPCQL